MTALRDSDLKWVCIGFNVRANPNETSDLSAKRSILTRQLQAKWQAWDKLSAVKAIRAQP